MMEKTRTSAAHRLEQAYCVQRASRKCSAVHNQPQVAPGGHDGDSSQNILNKKMKIKMPIELLRDVLV